MESIIVEIKAAEGGQDSKLLVKDMAQTYLKVCQINNLDFEIIDSRSGFTAILIEGKGANKIFKNEPGGHRWQRVPPTEKRGRVHTSTVTVAVLNEIDDNISINLDDIEYIFTKGTGPGGQHKNKTESCVIAIHKPTKISVKIDARNQHKNKALATRMLIERVTQREKEIAASNRCNKRKSQVGSGMRGDKRRTYRSQNDSVIDHITHKKWKLKKWIRGAW